MVKKTSDPTKAKSFTKKVKLPSTKVATNLKTGRSSVKITFKNKKFLAKKEFKTISLGAGKYIMETFYTPSTNTVTIKYINISELTPLGKKRLS